MINDPYRQSMLDWADELDEADAVLGPILSIEVRRRVEKVDKDNYGQHPLEDAICDALSAGRNGKYDGLTMEQHLESLLSRVRGE